MCLTGQISLGGSVLMKHWACDKTAQKMSQPGGQGAQRTACRLHSATVTVLIPLGL